MIVKPQLNTSSDKSFLTSEGCTKIFLFCPHYFKCMPALLNNCASPLFFQHIVPCLAYHRWLMIRVNYESREGRTWGGRREGRKKGRREGGREGGRDRGRGRESSYRLTLLKFQKDKLRLLWLHHAFCCLVFYCVNVPLVFDPLIYWWALRFLQALGYCKLCCYEHWGAQVLLDWCFRALSV